MTVTKRAYTDEAKQERENRIISAAESLLMEQGYYAINMDQVARAAGLAKGTVYLYFKTKEELFLKVFERQSAAWGMEIEQALSATAKPPLIDLLVNTTADKPLFTRLVALSPVIFEYNIPLEQLRQHKLWVFSSLYQLGGRLEAAYDLPPAQGTQLLLRMFVIVAGLEGFAHPSPITREVYDTEPSLVTLDFATELRTLLTLLLPDGD
jgi:AcrR family transcriptional regulator